MSDDPHHQLGPELVARVLASAQRVRLSLARALDFVVPPPRRPSDLVRVLGLDKSLASRLNRASSQDEPIEAVLDGAGVQGLRLAFEVLELRIVTPAQSSSPTNAAADALAEFRSAIDEFASICDAFPDGRVGLETVMADHMPEMRKLAERKARRAVFQSHSFLLGFHQDVVYKACIRVPSKTSPTLADFIYIELCIGMQKLRPGAAVMLAGVITIRADEPDKMYLTTLDGKRSPDTRELLIADRCSLPLSDYTIATRGTADSFALPASSPALAAPVNLGMGQILVGGMRRYATTERPFDTNYAILRRPIRTLVWDEFCDPALGSGPPEVTASFASYPGAIPARPELDNVAPLHQPESFESLGVGLGRLASRDVPDCRGLIESALHRAGVDPSRLSVHRLRIEYPVAHTRYVVWNRLMEPPR